MLIRVSLDWDRILDVNVKGAFMTVKHALPYLKQSPAGRIINIASVNSFRGGLGPAYTASKAGIIRCAKLGRCNAVRLHLVLRPSPSHATEWPRILTAHTWANVLNQNTRQ